MKKILDVYLYHDLAGQLEQDSNGRLIFTYVNSWLEKPNAIALSYSLPLQKESFLDQQCQGFFAGLLPEENIRRIIAKNLGISANNDFAMLEQIGGECAGAVFLVPAGTKLPERSYNRHLLTEMDLAAILKNLSSHPLMAGEKDVRLSLAGAQNKIAVQIIDDDMFLPLGGAPSSHIIKPAIEHLPGIVFNEAFCLKLAAMVGLPAAKTSINKAGDIEYLLVERYDRTINHSNNIQRVHQEDFCQALALTPIKKYQSEGGPSLKQCFDLIRHISTQPVVDIKTLLDMTIFNFLVGNHDAHGKNFSLLYSSEKIIKLAPLYDVLCTVYYPQLAKKMAMKIGGEYDSDKIFIRHFDRLAEEAGLAKPVVKNCLLEMAERIITQLGKIEPNHPNVDNIINIILQRCKRKFG